MTQRNSTVIHPGLCLLATAIFAACSGGGGGSSSFRIRDTNEGTAAGTALAISGRNAAFLADEATTGAGGSDLNGDGDFIDAIAIALDMAANTETTLGVAAEELAWIGSELYIVTDEALDDNDWNNDADTTDLVLLHWSQVTGMVVWVDDLADEGAPNLVAIGTNLFYATSTAPAGPMASNLRVISSSAPMTITPILTTDMVDDLSPEILAEEEGLIFLGLDETREGRDVNGDADQTDTAVLALLDGTDALGVIRNTGLALPDEDGPFRARTTGSHDWQVGFLVSETAQDATNFNDPGLFSANWHPPHCNGDDDADTTDDVLHFLTFALWNANPVTSPPRNTGLVGRDKIAIANSFIATISQESNEGTCDLNDDGDTADRVVRWTQILASPLAILPLTAEGNIHALFDVPGGTHGLAECDSRFVIVVSESDENQDLNGDTFETFNLVGWLSPSASAVPWDFTHSNTNTFVGASWMSEQRDRTRLDVALEERVGGMSINVGDASLPGDNDTLDSVPTFADFGGNPVRLNFPGVAIAVDKNNAGIVVIRNQGFYRVDEAEDNRDWNEDGDMTDFQLWRTDLDEGTSALMSVSNSFPQLSVFTNFSESPTGAVFVADEALVAGSDFNDDGDSLDLVLRYFRF